MLTVIFWIAAVFAAADGLAGGLSLQAAAKTALHAPKGLLANGVKDQVVISWEPVKNADGYEVFEKAAGESTFHRQKVTKKCKAVLKNKKRGTVYRYKVRAWRAGKKHTVYGKFCKAVKTTVPENSVTTIKNLLTTATAPVGQTMYIWGGGWNKADTGTGRDGRRIGLSPVWRSFASGRTSRYNYRNYRYKLGYGLDCSGFVGWVLYNVTKTANGKAGDGYVVKASKMAKSCADRGWGTYKKASAVHNRKAGDIMSSGTHVYIVVGACSDGSVVLVHSSPPGVRLCGTPSSNGKKRSQAVKLAEKYMKKNYPSWYRKYPDCTKDSSYLKEYAQFRWTLEKGKSGKNKSGRKKLMSDPDGYRKKSAKEILKDLYE